jgi:hypothetical protein
MLAGLYILFLLVFAATGEIRLRSAPAERYAPFLYWCAVLVGLLPVMTGDWAWSFVTLPLSLAVARMLLARRARDSEKATKPPPPQ